MKELDVALRCNIVTVSDDDLPYEEKTIIDHSSSEISTEDAAVLIDAVRKELETDIYKFYVGTSYRHLTIWDEGSVVPLTPPHDILGKVIGSYLPQEAALREMMKKSYDILNNHPLNVARAEKGLNKANSIWFWGAGTKPSLSDFREKTGLDGAMISAVDLLKGIAVGAGMKVIEVEGANGSLHTNYEGKASAAVKALLEDGQDFVYVHVEAPDEMGHQGSIENKITAIENLDSRVIAPIKAAMDASGEEYRLLVLPDHPTPIRLRTHTSDPVPYILYDSRHQERKIAYYNEKAAATTGHCFPNGHLLMEHLIGNCQYAASE
jgi:2,3-bisphosphoglycerate-independent phosphoglycerate mutase